MEITESDEQPEIDDASNTVQLDRNNNSVEQKRTLNE